MRFPKKLLMLIPVLASAINCFGGSGTFNDRRITLSLGVISDVHVTGIENATGMKFRSALQQLKETAALQDGNGLDGVLVVGDLINDAYRDSMQYRQTKFFRELYESELDPARVPLVYTVGNHDVFRQWDGNTVREAKHLSDSLGEVFFKADAEPEMKDRYECRHCIIGKCHVFCVTPTSHEVPATYDPEVLEWLDRRLKEVTAQDPDRYVLVLSHPMVYGTVYGSDLLCGKLAWYTEELREVLARYPQAVSFGGHLHFPLNDPRSIWQGEFTAMGCASVCYMAIEDGGYEDMAGKTIMKDRFEFSQGLLLQFDDRGNMRVTRMDFHNKAGIGEPWILSHPSKGGKHLRKYSHSVRKAVNEAPSLSSLTAAPDAEGMWTATFAGGSDDEFVHHYILVLNRDGKEICRKKILSDFYRHPQTSGMKKTWSRALGVLPEGEYSLTLTAYDSWGAESNPINIKFKQ